MILLSRVAVLRIALATSFARRVSTMSVPTKAFEARKLMDKFAERTGLIEGKGDSHRRYLWTDGFATTNFLGLARASSSQEDRNKYESLAKALVKAVHDTLGRYDPADYRRGWLDGASDEHPTLGGLRIGKKSLERQSNEKYNDRLEWDKDGQYFHYLVKWILALDQMARYFPDESSAYHLWSLELAKTAGDAFVHGESRMYWKMSVDLSRPQVPSMGAQDPLEGYLACARILRTHALSTSKDLEDDIRKKQDIFRKMIHVSATDDPLGIGGMLVDAYRVENISRAQETSIMPNTNRLIQELLNASSRGLEMYMYEHKMDRSAEHRLAFRELGLAIGLHAVAQMQHSLAKAVHHKYSSLAEDIEIFWSDHKNQNTHLFQEHLDINEVMLATSLYPDGFLREEW